MVEGGHHLRKAPNPHPQFSFIWSWPQCVNHSFIKKFELIGPGDERIYRKISNIRRTLVGNKIVDHSDVVGASPVGAAPTTSSFST